MQKITEKVLLEKSSPKTCKLEQIITLNLSKLGLQSKDLPVGLLSRLQSLERLDLSKNRLQEFPKNLKLPRLKYLDLSDNQMEDVTGLESLGGLEELKMEDNLYITVSDNYKMMTLLPKLRIYNGKDISTTANHVRYVYTDNLRTRIIAVWEHNFSLPDPITADKMSMLETDFVNAACQQVKFGPSSVSNFTKWRVGIIAADYLHSLTQGKDDTLNMEPEEESTNVTTPSKRKTRALGRDDSIRLIPHKRICADLPASRAADSPHKAGLRMKPQEKTMTSSPRKHPSTPTRELAEAEMPKRGSRAQQNQEEGAVRGTELPTIQNHHKTQPVSLKPHHILQCHSKQDSSEDLSTQLWACAFQPLPDSTGAVGGNRLVATCGGDSLCVIDCEIGIVVKKYKVPGEEFFSLAWTTILMSRGGRASAQHCSILAAGGKRGMVKLIHPRNNMAYGEFRASRKAVSVLRFNPDQGNILYTGSYDNKIVMWDIGGVDSQYNFKVLQLLVLEVGATPLNICLPPASPSMHLLAACEDGLHYYNTQPGTNSGTKRTKDMEITFPIYKKEDKDHDYHTIDGMSFLTDDIVASKNFMHGRIYLWSWSRTKAQRPGKNRMVCAVILAELQWANTEVPYLTLNTCPNHAYIVCGDDKGQLWTYHITDLHTGTPIQPTEVLEWPAPLKKGLGRLEGPSINNITMDPELHYLVALTDKNMVVVWKRAELS
ncbi:leucine-rich repeat and WD repeat-containing protein 1 isoform X2 [Sphaeramia orbicularis]|uniref:leucine-rich repeat and WD repeat-containing protein 1 isoform X2 n=1 Tax=Sphaeramia orbicularis TaxID=375764 RepID=UPI00117C7E21|nr:leucine-rich repeat and WD repeat-containing protein 1 isoform X2 [Sphaeramia orbicularis]